MKLNKFVGTSIIIKQKTIIKHCVKVTLCGTSWSRLRVLTAVSYTPATFANLITLFSGIGIKILLYSAVYYVSNTY